jgi:hypothetical protein
MTQPDFPAKDSSFIYTTNLRIRRNAPLKGSFGKWIACGQRLDEEHPGAKSHPWYRVLWLTGVDYFSTLGSSPI